MPKKRKISKPAADSWVWPEYTESEDRFTKVSNNQSASQKFTGCEAVDRASDKNFDINRQTVSSSELMSSEEEVEKNEDLYKPLKPTESDPLWSSTSTTQDEQQDMSVDEDEEWNKWADQLESERQSIEDLSGMDSQENTQQLVANMRERNLKIALEHSRHGLEELYKPNMTLAEVIEVGMMDLDDQGILAKLTEQMLEEPDKPDKWHYITEKGRILLDHMLQTITINMKRFLDVNAVDLRMFHHTRITALQRRVADALGRTIKKSMTQQPILEYDRIRGIAVVIPGPTTGMWWVYELETYMKVMYMLLIVERVPLSNTAEYWRNFSQRMCKYGAYRDDESCKKKESYFVRKYSELRMVQGPLTGLNNLIYHVMGACGHVNPPALGSVRGVMNRNGAGNTASQTFTVCTVPNTGGRPSNVQCPRNTPAVSNIVQRPTATTTAIANVQQPPITAAASNNVQPPVNRASAPATVQIPIVRLSQIHPVKAVTTTPVSGKQKIQPTARAVTAQCGQKRKLSAQVSEGPVKKINASAVNTSLSSQGSVQSHPIIIIQAGPNVSEKAAKDAAVNLLNLTLLKSQNTSSTSSAVNSSLSSSISSISSPTTRRAPANKVSTSAPARSNVDRAALPDPTLSAPPMPVAANPVPVNIPVPPSAAGHGSGQGISQSPWGALQNFAPVKKPKSDEIGKELLHLAQKRGEREDVLVNALVDMTQQWTKRNEQDQQQTTVQRPQLPQSAYYAKRHMCSTMCPVNCRQTFDT